MIDELTETATGCPHPEGDRTDYTGSICTACYRETEMRITGFAATCRALRHLAAPSSIAATQLAERVDGTRDPRLIIDEKHISLADDLFRAGVQVVLDVAAEIRTPRPVNLVDTTSAPAYSTRHGWTARDVEAWLARNLWLIVALPDAWEHLEPLVEQLTIGRRAVDPSPPRRPAIRGACGECLSPRVTIEVRERGIFHSTCGGCGKAGVVPARVVEAVLRGDSDRSGATDRPDAHDAVEVPVDWRPDRDPARP